MKHNIWHFLVEDHFAKALGDTWVKLQAEAEKKDKKPSSVSHKSPAQLLALWQPDTGGAAPSHSDWGWTRESHSASNIYQQKELVVVMPSRGDSAWLCFTRINKSNMLLIYPKPLTEHEQRMEEWKNDSLSFDFVEYKML